jgi:hypothetical protein
MFRKFLRRIHLILYHGEHTAKRALYTAYTEKHVVVVVVVLNGRLRLHLMSAPPLAVGSYSIFSTLHGWGPPQAFQLVQPVGRQVSLHGGNETPLRVSSPRDCIVPGPDDSVSGPSSRESGIGMLPY